jgi:hypothetical protein
MNFNHECGIDVSLIKSCPAVFQAFGLTNIKIDFKGKDGRKYVASGAARRTSLRTCFLLQTMDKWHSLKKQLR